jgi:hypothetical protein
VLSKQFVLTVLIAPRSLLDRALCSQGTLYVLEAVGMSSVGHRREKVKERSAAVGLWRMISYWFGLR